MTMFLKEHDLVSGPITLVLLTLQHYLLFKVQGILPWRGWGRVPIRLISPQFASMSPELRREPVFSEPLPEGILLLPDSLNVVAPLASVLKEEKVGTPH